MNKLKNLTYLFLVLLISCSTEEEVSTKTVANKYQVPLENVLNYASTLNTTKIDANGRVISTQKKVKNHRIIKENDLPTLYLVNYENEEGYIIISADRREFPLLGYSSDGNLSLDSLLPGVSDWMKLTSERIAFYEQNSERQNEELDKYWVSVIAPPSDGCNCSGPDWYCEEVCPGSGSGGGSGGGGDEEFCGWFSTNVEIGPLLDTEWGQGCGYNDNAPVFLGNNSCDNAPTGCLATSIAQVMRYHEFPNTYSWAGMPNWIPNNTIGEGSSHEISRLMRDVGDALSMQWGENASGAYMSDADNVLVDFGYSIDATLINYRVLTHSTIIDNLENGWPMIFSGSDEARDVGHAWVCDGIRYGYDECGEWINDLHMNWGWNGASNNWFYWTSSFQPTSTRNYTSDQKMIVNIHPS